MEISYTQGVSPEKKKKRITDDRISSFEVSAQVKKRAHDLKTGKVDPLIEYERFDPIAIAMAEVEQGLLDNIIVRKIPKGDGYKFERMKTSEMSI